MFRPFAKKQIPNPALPGGPARQPSIYFYVPERLPQAGADRFSFHPIWHNPAFNLYGPSILSNAMQALPGAPLVSSPTTLTQGLGGIVAGQMMLQPLLDPNNTSGTGGGA